MAYMSDEKYEYIQDIKEKNHTAKSSHNRKGHCGKCGRVVMPSDHYTKKQLESMNGEVKTYQLGKPMSWEYFCNLPDDLKKMYIKELRKKFNVPDEELAVAFGIEDDEFRKCVSNLGIGSRKASLYSSNWYETEDHDKFKSWWVIAEEVK